MSLFNLFIDHITHNDTQTKQHAVINTHFAENFEQYRHLMKLQDNRQLLEVLLQGHKNSFQSMVIGIDFVNGTFSLDEFSPSIFSPPSLVDQAITIKHQQGWKKLEIHTHISHWSAEDNCFHLPLPEQLDYQPRRHHERVLLAKDNVLKTHINPLYGAPWYANVTDLSQGGMRIIVAGDLRPHLHKGKVLPKCQLMLDEHITVKSRGEVRGFSYINKPYRHTEISIEFHNMSIPHQNDLKRFIDYIHTATA